MLVVAETRPFAHRSVPFLLATARNIFRGRIKSHQPRGRRYKHQRIRERCDVTGISSVLYVEFSQLELRRPISMTSPITAETCTGREF